MFSFKRLFFIFSLFYFVRNEPINAQTQCSLASEEIVFLSDETILNSVLFTCGERWFSAEEGFLDSNGCVQTQQGTFRSTSGELSFRSAFLCQDIQRLEGAEGVLGADIIADQSVVFTLDPTFRGEQARSGVTRGGFGVLYDGSLQMRITSLIVTEKPLFLLSAGAVNQDPEVGFAYFHEQNSLSLLLQQENSFTSQPLGRMVGTIRAERDFWNAEFDADYSWQHAYRLSLADSNSRRHQSERISLLGGISTGFFELQMRAFQNDRYHSTTVQHLQGIETHWSVYSQERFFVQVEALPGIWKFRQRANEITDQVTLFGIGSLASVEFPLPIRIGVLTTRVETRSTNVAFSHSHKEENENNNFFRDQISSLYTNGISTRGIIDLRKNFTLRYAIFYNEIQEQEHSFFSPYSSIVQHGWAIGPRLQMTPSDGFIRSDILIGSNANSTNEVMYRAHANYDNFFFNFRLQVGAQTKMMILASQTWQNLSFGIQGYYNPNSDPWLHINPTSLRNSSMIQSMGGFYFPIGAHFTAFQADIGVKTDENLSINTLDLTFSLPLWKQSLQLETWWNEQNEMAIYCSFGVQIPYFNEAL